jgi:hypothetical protein
MISNTITGYQYITEQEADNARVLCNTYYGIPKSAEDETQNWVLPSEANLNLPIFWFINWDETLTQVLGQPTDFDVNFPDPVIPGNG